VAEEKEKEKPVILITGTSRGIGKALAEHFLGRGWLVVGCSRGEAAVSDPGYTHVRADVSKEEGAAEVFKTIRETHGRLDAAVNNAAINPTLSLALMTTAKNASETMTVNFLGVFLVCREAAKLMMRRKKGRIVNLGSMAVRHEVSGESVYTASKAAVNAFSRVLAKELAPSGITVNVVSPAAVETDMMKSVDPKALAEVLKRNAIPKPGTFADVASAVEWLVGPESGALKPTPRTGGARKP